MGDKKGGARKRRVQGEKGTLTNITTTEKTVLEQDTQVLKKIRQRGKLGGKKVTRV